MIRAVLDAMAAEALAEQPDALTLYALSAGHSVFETRRHAIAGLVAGWGCGAA
jgi:hypothetical protein